MRTLLQDIQQCQEKHLVLPAFVIKVGALRYNNAKQPYFNVYVTDGTQTASFILKDARVEMARQKFERRVVYLTLSLASDTPYIAKIEQCTDVPIDAFGDLIYQECKEDESQARPELSQAKDFMDRNYTLPVLVTGVNEKQTKNGDPYVALTVTDGETTATYNWWTISASEAKEKYQGQVVYLTIRMEQYPKIIGAVLSSDYAVSDFVITAPVSSEVMYNEIVHTLQMMDYVSTMAPVAIKIYEDNKEELLRWAGALKLHHSIYGGLLFHTYRMMLAAESICQVYPTLNRELLIIGTALHDIGKLRELNTDGLGVPEFTSSGNLEGHVFLGIEMLIETVAGMEEKPDDEEYRLVKHLIASHHGRKEWGAIVVPATPEAMVLHYLDMIDSRMYVYEDTLKKLDAGEVSTPVFALEGAHVYKPVMGSEME